MNKYKVYTAGKMGGLPFDKQMGWRKAFENELNDYVDHSCIDVFITHPPLAYTYENHEYQSEREVQTWDLNHIADSDIVVVSLDDIESSIGTIFELGFIHHFNQTHSKKIYVIGIGGDVEKLHPWIMEEMYRVEKDVRDAAHYIADFLLW